MAKELGSLAIELLDIDNYATWETRMKFLLITRGLWTAIDDEQVDPDTDQRALAVIGLCVKEHHLTMLKRCSTAKEAWLQLEAVYRAKSSARRLQLKKELAQLKMLKGEALTKYAARAVDIQDQLRAAGHEISDQEVAWALLAGLPDTYDMMVTVLTATEKEVRVEDILPKLLQVEQQQKAETEDERALAARHGSSYGNGYGGNNPGRRGQHGGAGDRTCYYCGKVGHIKRDCRKRKQVEAAIGNVSTKVCSAIAL